LLGVDPGTREEVWLKTGRFGPYLQRGSGEEPVRSSLPPGRTPAEIDLDTALAILALPREIGTDPNTGLAVRAVLNRYGAFVESGTQRRRLDADDDVLTIGLNRALALLAEPAKRGERAPRGPSTLKELGPHPDDGKPVQLSPTGRFGPYVKHGTTFASLPKSLAPDEVGLEQALELLRAKAAKGGGEKKGARRKGAAAAKPEAKAAAATKPAAKTKAGSPGRSASKAPAKAAARTGSKAKPAAGTARRRTPAESG
jgi:DNA topoisomerase-1